MTNDIIPCLVCDGKKKKLYDWYHSQLEALQRDFHDVLLVLAEEHANGEHDEGRNDAEDSG